MDSRHNDKEVTPANFLAERICERMAIKNKKPMPYRFWQTDEWKKTYQMQVVMASRLLQEYSFEVITATLKNPRCKHLYSFGTKALWKPFLEKAKKELDNRDDVIVPINEDAVHTKPAPPIAKRSVLGDLNG